MSVDDRSAVMLRRGRLNGQQRGRLCRLLDMLYTPNELANEIGFTVKQVYRVYIPLGCPCAKINGRRWINGKAFREWVGAVYPKCKLAKGETFCLTCKQAVPLVNPDKRQKGSLVYWLSDCPQCGRRLTRIIEKRGASND